jgi:hypothetical protein
MIDYRIRLNETGALFSAPRTNMLLRRYADDTERTVAEYALGLVRAHLVGVLKQPTGYYQSQVQVRYRRGDPEVSDGGVIYGPWLEGVGSRNAPVTRFKGYSTFRRVGQVVDQQAGRIADRVWSRYAGAF